MGAFRQRGRRGARTSATGFGLPVIQDPANLMAYEFARARRYERPISMMVMSLTDMPADGSVRLRFSDMLAVDERRGLALVLLPETPAGGVAGAVRRVRAALPPDVQIGAATFPEDAFTLEDLTEAAAGRLVTTASAAEAA